MNYLRYIVLIRRTPTGYSADAPDVLGCAATGMAVEHTKQMIAEAIEFHLESMFEDGETIPVPSTHFDFSFDNHSDEEFFTWVEVQEPRSTETK